MASKSISKGISKAFGVPKIKVKIKTPSLKQQVNQARFKQMVQQRKIVMQPTQEISENTRMMLENLRRIQNKGKVDDLNMQRINREKRMVADAGNLMNTPNMFGPDSAKLNILDMQGNILQATNVFAEREDNRIMTTNRPSLLNTKEVGNNLNFGTV